MNTASHYDFVLYGSLAELARHDRCQPVAFSGGMKLEVEAYLDAGTGALVLTWRIPEG